LQLKIARALIPRLEARHNRVGLVSFTFRARTFGNTVTRLTEKPAVIVPVGEPGAVLAALEDFPPAVERRRTNLTLLLERGAKLLDDSKSETRPRVILLLSLGRPSAPNGLYWSSKEALEYARELALQDIELWAIPLGDVDREFLAELTQSGGGGVLRLDQLDAQFAAPASSDSRPGKAEAGADVEIETEPDSTSQQDASSLHFTRAQSDPKVSRAQQVNTKELRFINSEVQ
jgi:hypothetical protein